MRDVHIHTRRARARAAAATGGRKRMLRTWQTSQLLGDGRGGATRRPGLRALRVRRELVWSVTNERAASRLRVRVRSGGYAIRAGPNDGSAAGWHAATQGEVKVSSRNCSSTGGVRHLPACIRTGGVEALR